MAEINAAAFISQVKVDDAQVKDFYQKHQDKFRAPEQVRIEYVMLSANNLIPGMQVSEDEAKKYYSENASKFQGDEQRRASHILIGFGGKTDPASKKAALEKAQTVLAEAKKNPQKFEELARKYSQDPGSAEKGGDLGAVGRGQTEPEFEAAAFALKEGEVSGVVKTQYGYHILKGGPHATTVQPFEDVKDKLREMLAKQKQRVVQVVPPCVAREVGEIELVPAEVPPQARPAREHRPRIVAP